MTHPLTEVVMHHSEVRARQLIARLRPGEDRGAEVGVWAGEMSAHMLRFRPTLHLTMVDNWLPHKERPKAYIASGDPLAYCPEAEMLNAMREAEARTAFATDRRHIIRAASVDAARDMAPASLDFVFVDADHSYGSVSADIAAWLPTLKPGGLLCGHDYRIPGEHNRRGWPGVVRAVDEFIAAHSLALDRGDNATWFARLP